jgi:tetratricopeptide (TPR) repeat protein
VLQKLREDVVQVNDLNAMAVVEAVENRSISGNDPQAMSILAKYIETPDFAQLLRQQMWYRAAQLAEISRQFALSDELYGSVHRDGRTGDGDTEYLAYLSRRARFDEALELWERSQSELSTNLKARSLAAIARAGKAPSEVCAKVELLIREVMTRIPEQETDEQVGALLALADVYDLQERFAEARSVYGQILASDPRNIVALNNMSQLACHADKPAERQRSVELIDQAIEIAGPLPALLDSRAIVKLNLEQLDSAVQDLRQALDQDSNPMFWLHLAYVQIRRNDLRGASEAFERASDPQIEKDKLHPLERPLFEELQQRLAPPGT